MTTDKLNSSSVCDAAVIRGSGLSEEMNAHGKYSVKCYDEQGNLKWEDEIQNTVMTAGKNAALDAFLSGSSYTATCYMGLISSVGYSTGPVVGDLMNSHSGWAESGFSSNNPMYSGTRKTCVWSSASGGSKVLSSALSFSITTAGTAKGAFIVFSTGASATIGDTNGTLLSSGLFGTGDKILGVGDQIQVSYQLSA
jgi:hypothetical protein